MIPPRQRPVRPFELIRWARGAAARYELPALEAHLLLVLATYANGDCECWPGVRQLAADCRLRVVEPRGTCSTLSKALTGLQTRQLVWTRQGGRGRPAVRELLFDPDRDQQPADLLSAHAESNDQPVERLLSASDDSSPPQGRRPHVERPVQRPEQQEQPHSNGHGLLSADAESNSPAQSETNDNDPDSVRAAIRRSLADASSTRSCATSTLRDQQEDEVAPASTRRPDAGAGRTVTEPPEEET